MPLMNTDKTYLKEKEKLGQGSSTKGSWDRGLKHPSPVTPEEKELRINLIYEKDPLVKEMMNNRIAELVSQRVNLEV